MNTETATQATMDALAEERAEFEQFAKIFKILGLNLQCTLAGVYRKRTTQIGWICWLEARRRKRTP